MSAKRAAVLDQLRRDQRRERAALTPTERLVRAEELRQLSHSLHGHGSTRADESAELLLSVRAWFREHSSR